MEANSKNLRRALVTGMLFIWTIAGCGNADSSALKYRKDDEIVTFNVPEEGKEVVRIGFSTNMNWKPLIAALNAKFPTKQFIYDFGVTSGIDLSLDTIGSIVKKNDYDFVVSNYWSAPYLGADISDEPFLDNYLKTTLDSISSNGHIFGIPLPASAAGIYYNKDLFAKEGWTTPTSADEFISLCKTIKEAGYTPFDSCIKYYGQVIRILEGMTYDELFNSTEGMSWYSKLISGKATFAEYATPFFETAKRLFDEGVLKSESFSASLTTMRQNFFAGKIAMMDYTSDVFSLASSEKCPFELGLAPYPSTTGKNSPVLYSSSVVLYIPSSIKKDAKRYAFDTSVMEYLSTSEGQDSLLTGWSGVPAMKNYSGTSTLYSQVTNYMKSGTYHPIFDFAASQDMVKYLSSLIQAAVRQISEGTSVADAIKTLDESYSSSLAKGIPAVEYKKIGEATDDFSTMETSYYLADKIKAATSSDVALVPNDGFYRSNMAYILKGDITDDTRLFYQKGIGGKDFINTYQLTGAQLKNVLEHPIINGTNVDQFLAASGLKVEYAPWHKSGNRLVSVKMEDGSAIDDARLYTVACYAGVIDSSYLTSTVKTYDSLGDPQSFALASITADKTISPNISSRVKLDWDIEK